MKFLSWGKGPGAPSNRWPDGSGAMGAGARQHRLLGLALLLGGGVASAQNPPVPTVVTVPWVANAPRIPHDIISGVPTELKGVELGFVPPPPEGAPAFNAIDSVTIETVTTCGTDAQNFFLNGVAVGTLQVNNAHCTCDPPLSTLRVTNAAVLAAWNPDLQANAARYSKATETSHFLWAAMTVTQDGQAKRICISDRTGGNCTEPNLCTNNSQQAVDATRANAWANAEAAAAFAYSGATYEWNFGDGQSTGVLAIEDPRVIEAKHTYAGAAGSPFTARLTVCDAQARCASADYPMVIRDDTLDTRVNVAIDRGLWYLHKKLQNSGQIIPDGSYGDTVVSTAAAINAFAAHGHKSTVDPTRSPYARTATQAMGWMLTKLVTFETPVKQAGNPDSNGNGLGVTVAGRNEEVYQNGTIMDAIIASADADAPVTRGPLAELVLNGQPYTYRNLIQDMADGYAYGQIDSNAALPNRGSWNYSLTANGGADNSTSQWAAIGLIPAEREWGTTVPAFVKTENLAAARATWNANGVFGYSNTSCIWGCAATTPSGLVQWIFSGRASDHPEFVTSLRWIADNWGAGTAQGGNGNLVTGYYYGLFAATKAMRLAEPAVERLVRTDGTSFDWYNDPNIGLARALTDWQDVNTGAIHGRDGDGNADLTGLATQWGLIMLAPSLFAQAPKAVAQANPVQAALAQQITYTHSGSFHLNPEIPIVLYEWDFDGDGTYDYSTADANAQPTHAYNPALAEVPKVYTARLRVTDNQNPPLTNVAEVRITVDSGNVPPVARITPANPSVTLNTDLALSGATSFDPNAGAPLDDSIVRYEWDFDDSNGLVQFQDLGPNATARFGGACGVVRQVALRVTDSLGLQNSTFMGVTILCNQPPVARVAPQVVIALEGAEGLADGTSSSDPDGDVLTYAWACGGGLAVVPVQNGGQVRLRTEAINAGAAPRTYNCTLTVTDPSGASNQTAFTVEVRDRAPVLQDWSLQVAPIPPVVNGLSVSNLGDGWYRVSVAALATRDWMASATVHADDLGLDILSYAIDVNRDGQPDMQGTEANPVFGAYRVASGQQYNPSLRVDDGAQPLTDVKVFNTPANNPTLSYFFDLGADGTFEVAGGAQGYIDFRAPPGQAQVNVVGRVVDSNGQQAPFDGVLPLENRPPTFEVVRVLSQNGFDVVVSASAVDPDGDHVTYTIDWGDGSPATVNQGGLGDHTYPAGVYRSYTIHIVASDGRGGSVSRDLVVDFPAPAANRPPVIALARVISQTGFDALFTATATDPDNDVLTFNVTWGDGAQGPLVGGLAFHTYPAGVYRSYTIHVTVTDGRGGSDSADVVIDFPEPAANRPPVIDNLVLTRNPHGVVQLTVDAYDPEGGRLTYAMHWGDEAVANATMPLVAGTGGHEYAFPGNNAQPYAAWVDVSDPEGNTTRGPLPVSITDAITVLRDFSVQLVREGTVLITLVADDRDGNAGLVHDFDFDGDGQFEIVGQTVGSILHTYPEPGTYDVNVRVTDTWSGNSIAGTRRVVIGDWNVEDGPPVIHSVALRYGPRGRVDLVADGWDPEGTQITWRIHWGDEADGEAMGPLVGGIGQHDYPFPADGSPYPGYVTLTDASGQMAQMAFSAVITDGATRVDQITANLVRQATFLVSVEATDPDGRDQLRYAFDFDGDGIYEVGDQLSSSATHEFAEPGTYPVGVRITDVWSGATVVDSIDIVLAPWVANNRPPIIHSVDLAMGPRGQAVLTVDASDPDGDRITATVHWGDEPSEDILTALRAFSAGHGYPFPLQGTPYAGRVMVTDSNGASAEAPFDARVIDAPTFIREVAIDPVRDGIVLITTLAEDADGSDQLVYSFDFDGDGIWDRVDQVANGSVFTYAAPGEYTVHVAVTDTWSGVTTEGDTIVRLEPWVAENLPPIIHTVSLVMGLRGQATLTVVASDPDGSFVNMAVHWGTEAGAEDRSPLLNGAGMHLYPFPVDGQTYAGHVVVTDADGATARAEFVAEVIDHATIIDDVTLTRVNGGTYVIAALAHDADGPEPLRYSFGFGAGDTFDINSQVANDTVHSFDAPGSHLIRVRVTDTWSGGFAEAATTVEIDGWLADNQPPVIREVVVSVGRRGAVTLTVDAIDPEAGPLTSVIHWGDEAGINDAGPLVALVGSHDFAWPGADMPYHGFVEVTDDGGLTAHADFDALVIDSPTVIREVRADDQGRGSVQFTVVATDPDSDALVFGFDVGADGDWEADGLAAGVFRHVFNEAGDITLAVSVTDDWSGAVATEVIEYTVAPWIEDVPVGGDRIEGDEGGCLVFRVGDDLSQFTTKVDATVCDRETNPDPELWAWTFGDGALGAGSEVGHRYADDGLYPVVVEGGTAGRLQRSAIQVQVNNVAPSFVTDARTVAQRGQSYRYAIRIDDPGLNDEVRLELRQAPEGMVLGRGLTDREWTLVWDVPADFEARTAVVELRATDGRTENGEWVADGGETFQNFELNLGPYNGGDDQPIGGDDAGVGADMDNAGFDSYTGSACSCDVTADDLPGTGMLLGLLGLIGLGLRRRRDEDGPA